MTTVQSDFFWSDAFLLGYGAMDVVHQEFVDIVSAMQSCPNAELLSHFTALALHVEDHFAQENTWMRDSAFPAMACHIEEHSAVQKSVAEVMALVSQGNIAVGRRLAHALADWFPGHADYLDAALAQWMVKRRTGGAPLVFKRNLLHAGH